MSNRAYPGFVYVFSNPYFKNGVVKVGYSTKVPDERATELNTTGVPTRFVVEYYAFFDDCRKAEKKAHNTLQEFRIDQNREFFSCGVVTAVHAVESAGFGFVKVYSKHDYDLEVEKIRKQKEAEKLRLEEEEKERVILEKEKAALEEERKRIEKEIAEANLKEKEKLRKQLIQREVNEKNRRDSIIKKLNNNIFDIDVDCKLKRIYLLGKSEEDIKSFFIKHNLKTQSRYVSFDSAGRAYFPEAHADQLVVILRQIKEKKRAARARLYRKIQLCVWFLISLFFLYVTDNIPFF